MQKSIETTLDYYKHGCSEEVAEWAAEQSHSQFAQQQKIKPVASEDLYKNYAGVAAWLGGTIVGYVGAKQPVWIEEDNRSLSQISTLVVPAEHQGQGIASALVWAITHEVAEDWFTPFAFSNPASRPAFKKANYQPLHPTESLPSGASSSFGNQPLVYQGPVGNYLLDSNLHGTL